MATAPPIMTTFVRIRRLMSMPDRKASSIETATATLPAVSIENKAFFAPKTTGSRGDHGSGKVTHADHERGLERTIRWAVLWVYSPNYTGGEGVTKEALLLVFRLVNLSLRTHRYIHSRGHCERPGDSRRRAG